MSTPIADAIIYGGNIITMDDEFPDADTVALSEGRILAVGKLEELTRYRGVATQEIHLRGQSLIPGFIEAHSHPEMSAIWYHHYLHLGGFKGERREDVWASLKKKVNETERGTWVTAVGWNPLLVKGLEAPTIKDLDDLTSDHPLQIVSSHGHSMYCNTRAFEAAGIKLRSTTSEVDGFVRDSDGYLTGLVLYVPGFATDKIDAAAPRINSSRGREILMAQLMDYAKGGYTTVASLGFVYSFENSQELIPEIVKSPSCPVRMVVFDLYRSLETLNIIPAKGCPGEDNYCSVGVKWHADGSPYSGTMAPSEPYLDTPMTRDILHLPQYPYYGELNYTEEELYTRMISYHKKGWQLASHCHGERAITQVLSVYERLLREYPRSDHRYRLEHCGLITRHHLQKARDLGVTPSFFMDHVHYYGRVLRDGILGKERAERFMPLYDATEMGLRWTLHSDSPCGGPLDPLKNIQTAVTRAMRNENPGVDARETLGVAQAVSLETALRACTIDAAWQLQHDHLIGSITPGKMADFTVLSDDPRRKDPYELHEIKVNGTYRNGKIVATYP